MKSKIQNENTAENDVINELWLQAKTTLSQKLERQKITKQGSMTVNGSTNEDRAKLITARLQQVQNSLHTIIQDTLSYPIKIWDLIEPQFATPKETILQEPKLLPIPIIQEPLPNEAPSYQLKPLEKLITIEDFEDNEPRNAPKNIIPFELWIAEKFKTHPIICWGLIILTVFLLIGV
jgi:hypothetical protein